MMKKNTRYIQCAEGKVNLNRRQKIKAEFKIKKVSTENFDRN